jgi:hypothetical protein
MNDSGDLTRAELYDRLKGQMQYEDELIDKIRVVWQLLAQSFFFSTCATLLNAKGEGKDELFVQQQEFLLWGGAHCRINGRADRQYQYFTSIYTIENLGDFYQGYKDQRGGHDHTTRLFPPIQGPEAIRRWGQSRADRSPAPFHSYVACHFDETYSG